MIQLCLVIELDYRTASIDDAAENLEWMKVCDLRLALPAIGIYSKTGQENSSEECRLLSILCSYRIYL